MRGVRVEEALAVALTPHPAATAASLTSDQVHCLTDGRGAPVLLHSGTAARTFERLIIGVGPE